MSQWFFTSVRTDLVSIDNQIEYEYVNGRISEDVRNILSEIINDFRKKLNLLERD